MQEISKRQRIRKSILMLMVILFPIVFYYFSPYLIIVGAFESIVTGSFLLFTVQFVISIFFGRSFCGWLCPAGGFCEAAMIANNKPLKSKKADIVKYVIWIVWLGFVVFGFVSSGGIKQVDPLYMTTYGISVASPEAYIIYLIVLFIIVGLSIFGRKRLFCHSVCWMAPFMVVGRSIRNALHLPALQLRILPEKCTQCKSCESVCPMSLKVSEMVKAEKMENTECILCGECAGKCPSKVIGYSFGLPKKAKKD